MQTGDNVDRLAFRWIDVGEVLIEMSLDSYLLESPDLNRYCEIFCYRQPIQVIIAPLFIKFMIENVTSSELKRQA